MYSPTQIWLERGSSDVRSDKSKTALAYKFDDFELSLAWREEISGRFEETGAVLAVSQDF